MNKLWHCDAYWNLHSIFICYHLKFIKFYLPTQIWDCLSWIFGYYHLTAMFGVSWFSLLWYCICKVIFLPNFLNLRSSISLPCLSHFELSFPLGGVQDLFLLPSVHSLCQPPEQPAFSTVEYRGRTFHRNNKMYYPIILCCVMTWKNIIWALSAMKACESCNTWVAFGCFKNEHIQN